MLGDPQTDMGDLIPSTSGVNFITTFTESQLRVYRWVEGQFDQSRQIRAAIVGPAGTGKSYLLKGLLIELAKCKGLIVSKQVELQPTSLEALQCTTSLYWMLTRPIARSGSIEPPF